jgi:N6-L-threonylcarbamoyladenine synthase
LLEKTLKDMPVRDKLTDQQLKDVLESFRIELEKANPDLWESISHAEFLKNIPSIDKIAVTEGPGLEPALWVGINFARVLGELWGIPIIPINHMEGHIVGSLLPSDAANGAWQKLKALPLPAIALLISGGHTELVSIKKGGKGVFRYEIIGQTKDDAVGEAFDKAARLLGLPYPGGPHIAKLAHEAYEEKIPAPIKLPRPMLKSGDLDFSFSGLKTAVLYAVRDEIKKNGEKLADTFKKGLAYEFEQAVADVLDAKLRSAIERTASRSIIIGGGVAANHVLRARFEDTAKEYGIPIFMPSRHISGDNALMIALAGALDRTRDDSEKPPAKGRELRADGTKRLS